MFSTLRQTPTCIMRFKLKEQNKIKTIIQQNRNGYTLVELMVIVAISAALFAVAVPSLIEWRQSLTFRQTGKEISSLIREAKSIAISTNRQQRIVLDGLVSGTFRNYRLEQGDRAVLSTAGGWIASTRFPATKNLPSGIGVQAQGSLNGTLTPSQVLIVVNPIGSIQFSGNPAPAGTDISMNLNIMQISPASNKYRVFISQTGRVVASKQ